jgi:cytoskeletal protein CcmA (bactofilin family)
LAFSQRDDIVSPVDPDAGESEEPPRMTAIGPSIIGATMVLKGDLSLSEDLIIDGAFDGSITQGDQRLSIGESARVRATIRTGSAIIAGTVEGNIFGSRTVIVKRSARLHGALTAHRLCLETGANLEDVVLSGNIARTPVIDD